MKHHPYFAKLLSGDSERIAYGARTLNEGGLQSVPKLHFPGGALIGCSAGFVNVAKIKGTHNAMKTGMLAAEAAYDAIHSTPTESESEPSEAEESESEPKPTDMSAYEYSFASSWVHSDLYEVRNIRPSFTTSLGVFGGIVYSGIDSLLLKGRTPWTFRNTSRKNDAQHTKRARECKPIDYPPPQAPLSSDLLTALSLTNTNHAEDQPAHLRVRTEDGLDQMGMSATDVMKGETPERRGEHVRINTEEYAGLLGRACPAAVYEYVEDEAGTAGKEGWGGKKLVINAQVRSLTSPTFFLCDKRRCADVHVRIVYIVSFATSRYPHKTFSGPFLKVAEVLSTVRFVPSPLHLLFPLLSLLRSRLMLTALPFIINSDHMITRASSSTPRQSNKQTGTTQLRIGRPRAVLLSL